MPEPPVCLVMVPPLALLAGFLLGLLERWYRGR